MSADRPVVSRRKRIAAILVLAVVLVPAIIFLALDPEADVSKGSVLPGVIAGVMVALLGRRRPAPK